MKQKKSNSILSEKFTQNLFEITAGYLPLEDFKKLIDVIESYVINTSFDQSTEANFLRIIQSFHDKTHFLQDIILYTINRDAIITIAQNSNYFTDILIRNPEYFYYAISPQGELNKIGNNFYETSIKNSLEKFKSFESKVRILKSLKRKEILRIGIQDILFNTSLDLTTKQLSLMAKQICSSLFELCLHKILDKYSVQKKIDDYCIIALGKLGGNELNYSSDIDLIIFYDEDEEITKSKSKREILTEAIVLFIQSSTENNEDGFLYRIDFRLRPDGRNAPLCSSLSDYLNYYESRGEDWERQMLLKSSFVYGQNKLYENFIFRLRPFIYPTTFSSSPVEQIKKLKVNIENKISDEQNIKLSPGGIRDIEFSVQALQLINGGKIPELRQQNTLMAIAKLRENNLLNDKEANSLTEIYIFFRKIEHFLQFMNNRQTHTLPEDTPIRNKLSTFLGFNNFLELSKELQIKTAKIILIRNSILGSDVTVKHSTDWLNTIDFENDKQARRNIRFLREGMGVSGRRLFDKTSITAFSKIEDELFQHLKSCVDPDLTLDNFVKVIHHTNLPSVWYNQLKDKKLLEAFIILCQFNQHAIELLFNNEVNQEFFLSWKFSQKLHQSEFKSYSIQNVAFILSTQFTLGLITKNELSLQLKKYIEQIIFEVSDTIFRKKISKSEYFIASLGSFSTGEINFASDVDLLFIVKDLQKQSLVQNIFQKFLLELKSTLKSFDVDCRLRPEGRSSNLVWDLDASIVYLQSRARIWELQAFTKINFFAGDHGLYDIFYHSIKNRIAVEKPDKIKSEILAMHKNLISQTVSGYSKIDLKKSRGGLIDLEFIIQYNILCHPEYFNICSGKSPSESLKVIEAFFPDAKLKSKLEFNHSYLKEMQLIIQTMFNSATNKIPTAVRERNILKSFFSTYRSDIFESTLSRILKQNDELFNKIFRGDN